MPAVYKNERYYDFGDIPRLTNNTGQVADDTVAAVAALAAAPAALADAAARAETNTALTTIQANISDLTDKVNLILDALDASGTTI